VSSSNFPRFDRNLNTGGKKLLVVIGCNVTLYTFPASIHAKGLSYPFRYLTRWIEAGKVYKVTLQPMTTSNFFETGHRIRLEVSSSNFPRFDRNLNTGGKNYDESKGVVAHNSVHHSRQYPSEVRITVVKKSPAP
jgi:predicted acyl esterase